MHGGELAAVAAVGTDVVEVQAWWCYERFLALTISPIRYCHHCHLHRWHYDSFGSSCDCLMKRFAGESLVSLPDCLDCLQFGAADLKQARECSCELAWPEAAVAWSSRCIDSFVEVEH